MEERNTKNRQIGNQILIIWLFVSFFSLNGECGLKTKVIKSLGKIYDDVIKQAEKISGKKILKKETREVLTKELKEAVEKYGDDVLEITRKGGIEVLEMANKYGDDVWRMLKDVPQAARIVAIEGDKLIPLTRKFGIGILKIESRYVGISGEIVKTFGNKGLAELVKVRYEEIKYLPQLIGMARKNPTVKDALLTYYKKTSNKGLKYVERFMEILNKKKLLILTGGLTYSMIIAAYKEATALAESTKEIGKSTSNLIEKNSQEIINKVFLVVILVVIILFGIPIIIIFLRKKFTKGEKNDKNC